MEQIDKYKREMREYENKKKLFEQSKLDATKQENLKKWESDNKIFIKDNKRASVQKISKNPPPMPPRKTAKKASRALPSTPEMPATEKPTLPQRLRKSIPFKGSSGEDTQTEPAMPVLPNIPDLPDHKGNPLFGLQAQITGINPRPLSQIIKPDQGGSQPKHMFLHAINMEAQGKLKDSSTRALKEPVEVKVTEANASLLENLKTLMEVRRGAVKGDNQSVLTEGDDDSDWSD